MSRILACIDGSVYADSVIDHAGWAAPRLGAGVDLLQVLGRREAASEDRSGRIVAGARRKLLEELTALDAERAKLLQTDAWLRLDEARARLQTAGVADAAAHLRHGDLLETLAEEEETASLVVIGKRGEAADFATLHLGSNLERIVRAATRPVLIAARAFRSIERMLIEFDGGPSAVKAVDAAAKSPLFKDIAATLLTVGEPTAKTEAGLAHAAERLRVAGLTVETAARPGKPEAVIAEAVEQGSIDLLMMGAYGHSRLRTLVIGSTTSALIRACQVPVAIYR